MLANPVPGTTRSGNSVPGKRASGNCQPGKTGSRSTNPWSRARRVVGVGTLTIILTLGHLALGQGVAAGTSGNCSAPGGSVIIAKDLVAGEHSAAAARIVVDASYSEMADGRIQLDGWSSNTPIEAVIIRTGPRVFELPGGQSGGGFVPPDGFAITQIRWCASTEAVPPTTISPPKDPGPVVPPAPTTTLPSPTTTVPPAPTTSTTLPPTTTTVPGSTTTTAPSATTTTAPVAPAPEPGSTTTTVVSTTTTVGGGASVPPADPPPDALPGSNDAGANDQGPDDPETPDVAAAVPTTTSTTTTVPGPDIVQASPEVTGETHEPAETTAPDVAALPPVPSPVEDSVELFSRMTTPQQVLVGAGLGVGGLLSGIGLVRRIRMPKLP